MSNSENNNSQKNKAWYVIDKPRLIRICICALLFLATTAIIQLFRGSFNLKICILATIFGLMAGFLETIRPQKN